MQDKSFRINIATMYATIYEGEAVSLVAPGQTGYFGVLIDHAPLIAGLKPGKITLRDSASKVTVIECKSAGILEVLRNNVNILLDDTEKTQ